MTSIVLEVTIVLYKNISAKYLVWHICQKGKGSLVVQLLFVLIQLYFLYIYLCVCIHIFV